MAPSLQIFRYTVPASTVTKSTAFDIYSIINTSPDEFLTDIPGMRTICKYWIIKNRLQAFKKEATELQHELN